MFRRRFLPLVAASAALAVIAASAMAVHPAAAQANDPFGNPDLNSLMNNQGGGQAAPTTPAPQTPAPIQQQRPSDPLSINRDDPIGSLTRTATFDRAKRIYVGKSKSGTVACYFREEGDTHRLDIGIAAAGAFVRLQTPEPREATPALPVRVFAGKEKTRRVGNNEFATGEYTVLKAYDGPVAFSVPEPRQGGFTALAKSNAKQFLEMVAAAKGEFAVVQSAQGGKAANIVAVYRFNSALVPVLLSCAKAQHFAAAAPDGPAPPVSAAAAPEGWRTYANARFGTAIEYPAGIFSTREPPPENGDGQAFRSADGRARLLVYGANNVENDTPQSYVDKYVDPKGVSFRRVTRDFFAVSGVREGAIFYQRCNFAPPPGDTIHCFMVTYPSDRKATWNPIVGRLSRTLRPAPGR
jgi:hypothetical protein